MERQILKAILLTLAIIGVDVTIAAMTDESLYVVVPLMFISSALALHFDLKILGLRKEGLYAAQRERRREHVTLRSPD
jgi:hypothetical protein